MGRLDTIFLVDDDDITNFLHQNLIEESKLADRIEVFTDGEKAFLHLKDHMPDLVLLDLNMPAFDGFEFLESLNALGESVKSKTQVVIVTTSTNPRDTNRLRDLGYDQVINKPLTKSKLEAVISGEVP